MVCVAGGKIAPLKHTLNKHTISETTHTTESAESRDEIVKHNTHLIIHKLEQVSGDESMGGNAGSMTIDGEICSCTTVNGYINPQTGQIIAFGNIQSLPADIDKQGTSFSVSIPFSLTNVNACRQWQASESIHELPPPARQIFLDSMAAWIDWRVEQSADIPGKIAAFRKQRELERKQVAETIEQSRSFWSKLLGRLLGKK